MDPDAQGTSTPRSNSSWNPSVWPHSGGSSDRRRGCRRRSSPPRSSPVPAVLGEPDLGLDFTRVLHGSQEYEFGDRSGRARRFGRGRIGRSGGRAGALSSPRDGMFDETGSSSAPRPRDDGASRLIRGRRVAVGDDLPELRASSAADVKAYADAGGDQNPLHQDEAFARGVGFPGIIAHGMFTMGHIAAWWWPGREIPPPFFGDRPVPGARVHGRGDRRGGPRAGSGRGRGHRDGGPGSAWSEAVRRIASRGAGP